MYACMYVRMHVYLTDPNSCWESTPVPKIIPQMLPEKARGSIIHSVFFCDHTYAHTHIHTHISISNYIYIYQYLLHHLARHLPSLQSHLQKQRGLQLIAVIPHTWKFLLLAVAILFGGSVAVTILTVSIHSSHSRGEAFVHRCGTHSAAGMSLTCASKMSYHILPVSKTRHRPWWLANVPMFGELGHGNPHFSWVNLLTCCCTPETTLGKVRKDLVKLYNIKYDTTSLTWNLRLLWDTYPMLSRKKQKHQFPSLVRLSEQLVSWPIFSWICIVARCLGGS